MPSVAETNLSKPKASTGDRFLLLHSAMLFGFAVGGRGAGHFGVQPIYIGEVSLAIAMLVLLAEPNWARILHSPPMVPMALMAVWGSIRTYPYLHDYGIDAVRDATLWGFSIWAVVVGGLLVARPERLGKLLDRYRVFVPVFLVAVPALVALCTVAQSSIPPWPGSNVPVIAPKAGDMLVHLGGVCAFIIIEGTGERNLLANILVPIDSMATLLFNRAGLLSFLTAIGIASIIKPLNRWIVGAVASVSLLVLFLSATGARFPVPGPEGDISAEHMANMFGSLTGDSGVGRLDNTREWRLRWWKSIWDYTVNGRYFWTGKGFGVNLADDDGFQVEADHSLRAPHDAHLAMLAHAGVPGLALWILVQLAWAATVLKALLRSYRRKDRAWFRLFLFLMAYWAAFLMDASLDVFLETPMGGIWFWSLFGVGLSAVHIYHRCPQAIFPNANTHSS